ncbi:MAG: TetR/AcrR family transcriptional regulator [Candidatus Phosphoribacter baldrii]
MPERPAPRPTPGRADGIRARNRASIEAELRAVGRRHLAEVGAAALSLRSVARELGMVPSALFRYVSGRDELLTLLIVDAYTSLGEAAEAAHAAVEPTDLRARWAAVAQSVRTWALAHPHEWSLIFGSPVPRYDAPADVTNDPGTRVPRLLMAIGADAAARRLAGPATFTPASRAAELAGRASEDLLRSDPDLAASGMTPVELANGLVVWTMLVGAVSAEVFQQLGERTISDAEAFFDYQVATAAAIMFGPGG